MAEPRIGPVHVPRLVPLAWMNVTIVPSGSRNIISEVEPPLTTVGCAGTWNPTAWY